MCAKPCPKTTRSGAKAVFALQARAKLPVSALFFPSDARSFVLKVRCVTSVTGLGMYFTRLLIPHEWICVTRSISLSLQKASRAGPTLKLGLTRAAQRAQKAPVLRHVLSAFCLFFALLHVQNNFAR
jgi:hypothetical protein